jgi:hypothetical protein
MTFGLSQTLAFQQGATPGEGSGYAGFGVFGVLGLVTAFGDFGRCE